MKALIITAATALLLTGAAQAQTMTAFNGSYYMVGDKACRTYTVAGPTSIVCYDSKGRPNVARQALTPYQPAYAPEAPAQPERQEQTPVAALAESLRQTGQWAQQFNNQMAGAGQSTRPTVQQIGPYGQPNSTAIVYCRDLTGAIIACRQIH